MVALYMFSAPVVLRRVHPFNMAKSSPWLVISMNSMSLEIEVDAEGMKRVNRMSSLVAKSDGIGSASPGVGQSVCFQSLASSSSAIKV